MAATAERVSGEDPQVILSAVQTSANMVGKGKAELIRDLRERKTHLSQRLLTEADWLHFDHFGAPRSKNPSTSTSTPTRPNPGNRWEEGSPSRGLEFDSRLSKVGNQGKMTPLSFQHPPGKNNRPNIFEELDGELMGKTRQEEPPKKFQFRNPDPNPPLNFPDSQSKDDADSQNWGGRGPTYRRNASPYYNSNQPRGGKKGKRPREESRDRNQSHQHNPREGRGRGRGARGGHRDRRGGEGTLTNKEWAIIHTLRQSTLLRFGNPPEIPETQYTDTLTPILNVRTLTLFLLQNRAPIGPTHNVL